MKLIIPIICSLCSCATLLSESSRQFIKIESSPSGSFVKMDALELGRTPLVVEIEDFSKKRKLLISRPGYHSQVYFIKGAINPVSHGNIANLGVGYLVDWLSNRMYVAKDKLITIDLKKK